MYRGKTLGVVGYGDIGQVSIQCICSIDCCKQIECGISKIGAGGKTSAGQSQWSYNAYWNFGLSVDREKGKRLSHKLLLIQALRTKEA